MSAGIGTGVWRSERQSRFLDTGAGLMEVGGQTDVVSMQGEGVHSGRRSRLVSRFNASSSERSRPLLTGMNAAMIASGGKARGEDEGFGWARVVGRLCGSGPDSCKASPPPPAATVCGKKDIRTAPRTDTGSR